jgi:hypothetical protein
MSDAAPHPLSFQAVAEILFGADFPGKYYPTYTLSLVQQAKDLGVWPQWLAWRHQNRWPSDSPATRDYLALLQEVYWQ